MLRSSGRGRGGGGLGQGSQTLTPREGRGPTKQVDTPAGGEGSGVDAAVQLGPLLRVWNQFDKLRLR